MTLSAHPTVSGTTYMAVSGHPAASLAGTQILEAGGNAVDAGVAIGLCINVLESEMTGFAGVAPAMLRMAADGEVRNFVGVGPWPKNLDAALFALNHDSLVRPASSTPWCKSAHRNIWLTALRRVEPQALVVAEDAAMLGQRQLPNVPIHGRNDAIAFRRFQRIAGDGGNIFAGRGVAETPGPLCAGGPRAHAPVPCGRGEGRKPWRAGSVCTICLDQKSGILQGGADPRRNACAIGR